MTMGPNHAAVSEFSLFLCIPYPETQFKEDIPDRLFHDTDPITLRSNSFKKLTNFYL